MLHLPVAAWAATSTTDRDCGQRRISGPSLSVPSAPAGALFFALGGLLPCLPRSASDAHLQPPKATIAPGTTAASVLTGLSCPTRLRPSGRPSGATASPTRRRCWSFAAVVAMARICCPVHNLFYDCRHSCQPDRSALIAGPSSGAPGGQSLNNSGALSS